MVDIEQEIFIACGSDTNYAIPLAVTLSSMLMNLEPKSKVSIYVIADGYTDEVRKRLSNVVSVPHLITELHIIEPTDESLAALPALSNHLKHLSRAAFLRLLLPALLPKTVTKVLYLDSDLLVFGDVSILWAEPISDWSALAVQDEMIPLVSTPGEGVFNWKELGLSAESLYFNSGVMVINLEKWRSEKTAERALSYLDLYRENTHYEDQDALNALLADDWRPIDRTWNCVPDKLREILIRDSSSNSNKRSICHYMGFWKPWTVGRSVPFRREWMDVLKTSGYFSASEYYIWYFTWPLKHVYRRVAKKLLSAFN